MIPQEKARRSPRNPNWRGMYSSLARIAASLGNALKLVLTARNRISAVAAWKRRNGIVPSPKTAAATMATTVGPPGWVGRIPKPSAMTVIPMNSTPSSTAMVSIVLAAFFASGGLKAGTPLAIASTPVRATDPAAKARRTRMIPRAWVPNGTSSSAGGALTGPWPEAIRAIPKPIISRVMPTNK